MNFFITTLFVGVSLSMDAFSLALVYGTMGLSKIEKFFLSFVVGVYHFFMPLLGFFIGSSISGDLFVSSSFVIFIIFTLIGVMMIISGFKESDELCILKSFWSYLVFGLSVSIDSLTIGLGFNIINSNIFIVSFIFSLCSFLFTLLALYLGNFLSQKFGNYAVIFGGITLLIIAVTQYL